eukprot:scaffold1637_cov66-Phaeocystis_antarctica.AAC.5
MGRSFSKPSKRCEAFPTALNVNPQALCKFRSGKSVGLAAAVWPMRPTPAESRWRERSSQGEGRRLEHRSARRAVVCIGLRCLGQERLACSTIRTCRHRLRMGDGPVTEWVTRLEKPEQA